MWKVAVATVPSAMIVELKPRMRQLFPEQLMLLPAFVAAGPATTETLVISEEKVKDHCRPAGCAPPNVVRVMGKLTDEPGVPEPDPIPMVTLWPNPTVAKLNKARTPRTCRTGITMPNLSTRCF
jgi:hypothetical protein